VSEPATWVNGAESTGVVVARGACGCAWTLDDVAAGRACENGCPPPAPVTKAERLAVLGYLGSSDAQAGLDQLNAKGLAIVDAVAFRLRTAESGRRLR
jgi:hypothetical protein